MGIRVLYNKKLSHLRGLFRVRESTCLQISVTLELLFGIPFQEGIQRKNPIRSLFFLLGHGRVAKNVEA